MNNILQTLSEEGVDVTLKDKVRAWTELTCDTSYLGVKPAVVSAATTIASPFVGPLVVRATVSRFQLFTNALIAKLTRKGVSSALLSTLAGKAKSWVVPHIGFATTAFAVVSLAKDVRTLLNAPSSGRIQVLLPSVNGSPERFKILLDMVATAKTAAVTGTQLNWDACRAGGWIPVDIARYGSIDRILAAVFACFYYRTGEGDISEDLARELLAALQLAVITGKLFRIYEPIVARCCEWYGVYFAYCSNSPGAASCPWSVYTTVAVKEFLLSTSRTLDIVKKFKKLRTAFNLFKVSPSGAALIEDAHDWYPYVSFMIPDDLGSVTVTSAFLLTLKMAGVVDDALVLDADGVANLLIRQQVSPSTDTHMSECMLDAKDVLVSPAANELVLPSLAAGATLFPFQAIEDKEK